MNIQALFETVLEANLVNFLIMVCVLVWIFKKFRLGEFVDSIVTDTRIDISNSSTAVQNALDEYKYSMRESRKINAKRESIVEEAKESAKMMAEGTALEIQNKENELEKKSERTKEIYFERKTEKTVDEVKSAVYSLSLDTINSLMDENLHKKLVIEALDGFELEKNSKEGA